MRQTPLAGGSSKSTRMTSICPQVKSQKESMKPSGFNCINLPYLTNTIAIFVAMKNFLSFSEI